jgi:lipopolysaccharide transport system permease protein
VDLVCSLLAKDLRTRYKSTVLGYAWSVLHPLAFAMIFFVVFKIIMRAQIENYTMFLITGMFPWQWMQNSVYASNFAFLGNASLIKKVRFPRYFLVLSGVLNDLIHFVLSIPIILAFMFYYGLTPGWSWLVLIPLLVLIQFLLAFGLALAVGTFNLFFRDLERLTSIIMLLLFYATPVLYPESMVPPEFKWTLYVNPVSPLVNCWHGVFLYNTIDPWQAAIAGGWAVAVVLLGYASYYRLQWRFAEIV